MNEWSTEAAGLKLELPAWAARIVTVPAPVSVTVLPATFAGPLTTEFVHIVAAHLIHDDHHNEFRVRGMRDAPDGGLPRRLGPECQCCEQRRGKCYAQ